MSYPGPCCICGGADYELSCGGPTICPQCDAGNFTQATVFRQAKEMERLRDENRKLLNERRTLWLILKSNGGYMLEYADMQDYPGDDRALISRADDVTTKAVVLDAYALPRT